MKVQQILLAALLLAGTTLFAQDRFNPAYPRTVYFSCWGNGGGGHPTYSVGTWPQAVAKFDMMMITGARDGVYVTRKLRQLNPQQILLSQYVPMFTNDPPAYFMYRSYRGHLRRPIVPGQREIYVDTATGSNAGLPTGDYSMMYLVIDEDVIKVDLIRNDTTFIVVTTAGDPDAVDVAHNAGATVLSPVRWSGPGVYANLSEYCPSIGGKQSWDYLVDKFLSRHTWEDRLLDGVFFDFYAHELWIDEMTCDFDMNGVNDFKEHGRDWVNQKWAYGRDLWLIRLREAMNAKAPGNPNLILLNNGGPLMGEFKLANGHILEGFLKWGGFTFSNYANFFVPDYLAWMKDGLKPSLMSIQDYIPEKWAADGKERFWKMRFGLTTACIYEMYYGMAYGYNFNVAEWYDEFEADLGYPVDDRIITLSNGLVLRYFTKGVAVCNPTGNKQILTSGDLSGGPYYRMKGGQAPTFNTGEPFGSVELWGVIYNDTDWRGDGILLFRQPTTVISDIIVDSFDLNDTSPASNPVELSGNWSKKLTKGSTDLSLINPYYVQDTSKQNEDSYGYYAVSPGTGEATATWRPTIGVAGWYEISEWHGWHGDTPSSASEGTNVPFEIVINGMSKLKGTINQQQNYGTWNRLAFMQLPAGTSSIVTISNKSNGFVIADAMRFHYLGDNYQPNPTAPNPPQNVRLQQIK